MNEWYRPVLSAPSCGCGRIEFSAFWEMWWSYSGYLSSLTIHNSDGDGMNTDWGSPGRSGMSTVDFNMGPNQEPIGGPVPSQLPTSVGQTSGAASQPLSASGMVGQQGPAPSGQSTVHQTVRHFPVAGGPGQAEMYGQHGVHNMTGAVRPSGPHLSTAQNSQGSMATGDNQPMGNLMSGQTSVLPPGHVITQNASTSSAPSLPVSPGVIQPQQRQMPASGTSQGPPTYYSMPPSGSGSAPGSSDMISSPALPSAPVGATNGYSPSLPNAVTSPPVQQQQQQQRATPQQSSGQVQQAAGQPTTPQTMNPNTPVVTYAGVSSPPISSWSSSTSNATLSYTQNNQTSSSFCKNY
ncbi:unnamed protein product [Notodromas monacha]|uniref:Uncharacterized protein n=1 Tax=Notodromas monacha TaxID=399045 RepID=A0A7R9GBP1_9CRUS|nr:unnamed protein product [Notodromas monacha]CAG0916578.1 unnamed protein product [Notodromas monacha]